MYLYHYNKKILLLKKNYKLINQKKITSSFRYFQNLKSQQTLKNKKQTKKKSQKKNKIMIFRNKLVKMWKIIYV